MLFYYLAMQQNEVLMTSLGMQLHFSEKRGKYHCYRECTTCAQKRKVLRKVKQHWRESSRPTVAERSRASIL